MLVTDNAENGLLDMKRDERNVLFCGVRYGRKENSRGVSKATGRLAR